ncbi:Large terminase phage packaging protein [Octadecabacter temperatus]|uniref:Terminase-like family protein n=1 Tax=Octadecabacter temperatus TaxID=1458307 RepID=A0A0K0Y6H2_9RHOB|nr:terminase family protein [Octadecabacter temperatus]AKS46496.1 Terminase-like family protein [Octadecabacter temperatus]SIO15201.1 Large terminase phage packaging protein [Octadecabacter temperatus]
MTDMERDLAKGTSTLTSSDVRSGAALVASADVADRKAFLRGLSGPQLKALPYLFDFWALEHQLAPEGDWRTWVILGGRGAGKTRAGSEWVRSMVEGSRPRDPGVARRVGLIGETMEQAREVMVFGESGILACSPPDRRPTWIAGRQMLVWPNGAEARLYSAFDPERLRGPQFDAVWADEFAKWPKAQETWDMMQFGLRLGKKPRACVTTTPKNVEILKDLLARSSTVQTHASTQDNRAYLADGFLEEVQERYAGTRLGRQELDGVLLADVDGALWTSARLERCRVNKAPQLDRIVVAVDPPAGASAKSDACGIVVAGIVSQGPVSDWKIYVLEDASVQGVSPNEWAAAAIAAMDRHGADRLVAEVNQGGAMVETIVRSIDPAVPYRGVHATRGKAMRAEPVAALYEQGRVRHAFGLGALEDEMCQMTAEGYAGTGSPDRVDALVWALTDLFLEPAKRWRAPQVRTL